MKRTGVSWSIALALVAGVAAGARAEERVPLGGSPGAGVVTLDMNGAAPADIARRLGEILGGQVRFEGAVPQVMSLSLAEVPVTAALDKAAAAVGGKWERVFRFSKNDPPRPTPVARSGSVVTLRLADLRCATAASMVGRMVSAKLDIEGELEGTVSLSGVDMPVEEAVDAIAKAAGVEWHPIYLIRGNYIPPAPVTEVKKPVAASPGDSKTGEKPAGSKRARRTTEKKRPARTKYNQIPMLGAKMPDAGPPLDREKMLAKQEALSRHGRFANLFGIEDKGEREREVKKWRAGMETSARRLDSFAPRYRVVASRLMLIQLRELLLDYETLDAEQKKEVEPIIEYARERLKEAETILGQRP